MSTPMFFAILNARGQGYTLALPISGSTREALESSARKAVQNVVAAGRKYDLRSIAYYAPGGLRVTVWKNGTEGDWTRESSKFIAKVNQVNAHRTK